MGRLRVEGMHLPILMHVVAADFTGTNALLNNDPSLVKLPLCCGKTPRMLNNRKP